MTVHPSIETDLDRPDADLLAELADLDRSLSTAGSPVTLPPACYTEDRWFDVERRTIFDREWLCVGRVDHIPNPGDYYTITMIDEPLVVVRGTDGEVRVLSAVCQHRGHLVAEDGSGTARRLVCPYHHWAYDLEGRLVGAPTMQETSGFDAADYCLPSLRVEIWLGFIFVNFDADAAPLAPRLASLTEIARNFDLANAVSPPMEEVPEKPWNWKVQFENSNDAYHASRLHGEGHRFCPSHLVSHVPWAPTDAAIVRTQGFTHRDGSFNPSTRALMPVFAGLTEEERWRAAFSLVPPTLTIGFSPDVVWYFLVIPRSATSVGSYIGYLLDPAAGRLPLFEPLFDQVRGGVRIFNLEDLAARTAVQRGLTSRFARRSHYSHQEEALVHFNGWLVQRYGRALDDVAVAPSHG